MLRLCRIAADRAGGRSFSRLAESHVGSRAPPTGEAGARTARRPVRLAAPPRELWQGRRRTQSLRRAGDFHLWKLQTRGSARFRAMVRLRLERGHELAWVAARASAAPQDSAVGPAVTTAVGPGFPPAAPAHRARCRPARCPRARRRRAVVRGPSSEGLSTTGSVSNGVPNGASSAGLHPVSPPAGRTVERRVVGPPLPRHLADGERRASVAVLAAVRRPGSLLSWKTTAITLLSSSYCWSSAPQCAESALAARRPVAFPERGRGRVVAQLVERRRSWGPEQLGLCPSRPPLDGRRRADRPGLGQFRCSHPGFRPAPARPVGRLRADP